jgi:hypothetical protein
MKICSFVHMAVHISYDKTTWSNSIVHEIHTCIIVVTATIKKALFRLHSTSPTNFNASNISVLSI